VRRYRDEAATLLPFKQSS